MSPANSVTMPGSVRSGMPDVEMLRQFEIANVLARQGRAEVAARAYRMLLQTYPDFVEAHANLGVVLNTMRSFAEAEQHYRRVLDALPDQVSALIGLAYALQKQSHSHNHEAERLYSRALAIQPDCVRAMVGLGVCLRGASRLEEACGMFEQAVRVDPACIDAWYLLSTLKRFKSGGWVLEQCEALQPRVEGMPAKRQIRYWFALGRLREDVGRYADAFAAYERGNRLRAGQFVLDESEEDAQLQQVRVVFDATRLSAAPHSPAETRVPVFVVGMPRSGTTLIEQILASHPDVHGAGEISDLSNVLQEKLGDSMAWPAAFAQLTPEAMREMGDAYIARVWRGTPAASHVVNKTPCHYRHVGFIRMMLPRARIIHAVRDPMDACFSCYAHLFDGDNLPYTYDLESLGRYFARYSEYMLHWRHIVPDVVLDVRYEDLVMNTEAEVRRVLAHLGLAWNPRCLDFHRNTRLVQTASRAEVRRPIYTDSVARWKRFESHLGPLLDRVSPWR